MFHQNGRDNQAMVHRSWYSKHSFQPFPNQTSFSLLGAIENYASPLYLSDLYQAKLNLLKLNTTKTQCALYVHVLLGERADMLSKINSLVIMTHTNKLNWWLAPNVSLSVLNPLIAFNWLLTKKPNLNKHTMIHCSKI